MLSTEGKNIMETKGGRKLLSGRLVSLVLALSMIMSFLPFAAITVSAYGGGTGTASSPYLISSVAHLQELATAVNGGADQNGVYFKMTSNIAFDGQVGNFDGIGWETNYNDSRGHQKYFAGVFDGNGYEISGLNFADKITRSCGLFGYCTTTSVIKNLGVVNSKFDSQAWAVGAIAGTTYGTITNCWSSGNVIGRVSAKDNCSGGIAGATGPLAHIESCWNDSLVMTPGAASGGIVGFVYGGGASEDTYGTYEVVKNCYNAGTTRAACQQGGINGRSDQRTVNCYNIGRQERNDGVLDRGRGEGFGIDGIYGHSKAGNTNCYSLEDVVYAGINNRNGTLMKAADMKTAAFVSKLGSAFKRDKTWLNDGYPVLSWQKQNVIALNVTMGNLSGYTYDGKQKPVSLTFKNNSGTDIGAVIDPADYTVTYTCTNPSYNSTTPPTNAGVYSVKFALTATGKKYYSIPDFTQTMIVNKATGTMNVPDSVTKTYGDAAIPVGITLNNSEQKSTITYASTAASVASVTVNNNSDRTNATLRFGNAGTATITINTPASTNYTAITRTIPVTVNRAQGVITNEPPATINKNMRDADFLLGAGLNNSEQKLSYIFPSAQEVMQLDQNTGLIHLLNPGTTEITLLAPQSANWLQAEGTHKITLNVAGTAPDAPTLTAETGKPGMVPLKWTKPGFDGGDQIKSYTILRRIKPESGSSSAPFLPIVTVSDGLK